MEHFIAAVRQYPCLWNTAAIEYRDQELKDAAWAELMKETDLSSVKEVKLKWKKLRDSYRDALKRQSELAAREPGAAAKRPYPWKYMGLMQFLQPYMSNRKKAGGSPPPPPAAAAGRARSSSSGSSQAEWTPPRRPRRPRRADPLETFFAGMCQSTKRLPAATQLRIKRSLFAAVTAAEEALLASSASDDDAPAPPPA